MPEEPTQHIPPPPQDAGTVKQKEPWTFQESGADYVIDVCGGRGIEGDEMGLGKTGIAYLVYKRLNPNCLPTLLIGRKNAIAAFRRQAAEWGVEKPFIIEGKPEERKKMWEAWGWHFTKTRFLAVTRETLIRDHAKGWVPTKWYMIIDDEAHRDSNRKTQSFKLLKKMTNPRFCKFFLPLTGSPMERGAMDLWALLHLCNPKVWSSYWAFIAKYYITQKDEFGHLEILRLKANNTFEQDIAPYFIRRLKREVRKDMPPKIRDMNIVLEMTPNQKRIHAELMANCIAELSDPSVLSVAPTVLAKLTRLRQLLVCPKILDPNLEDGASIDNLIEMLEETSDKHMAIFTPFTEAIPFVIDRLVKEGYDVQGIITLQGGLHPDELIRRVQVFQACRGIAVCSISFAESFDLVPATWGYFLGPSWSVRENRQAEDRLDRMVIEWAVTIYYPRYAGADGVDRLVFDALDQKSDSIHRVLSRPTELLACLTEVD